MTAAARAGGVAGCEPNEWVAAMRAGDFERAWAITDSDLALADFVRDKHEGPRHQQRIWRGEALHGKRVLVRCYHGLGDTVQFIRFAKPLREIAREVVVWCQPELVTLVSRVEGVDFALPLHEGTPAVGYDVDVEVMEIPHAIRARRDQVQIRKPYLTLSGGRQPQRRRRAAEMAVGLVWDVGDWDKRRAIAPAELRRLNIPGVRLFSLQRGAAAKAVTEVGAVDLSTPDLDVLAHRLGELDLVICPDTMMAHLSAALGGETWVLLHADCDWRWPRTGGTTFWYPSARLFHQRVAGDWRGVIDDVSRALLSRLAEGAGSTRALNARQAPRLARSRTALPEDETRSASDRAGADSPD
jgi:hypothetical protein